MTITQLLHDITQEGYEITFNDDFEGMLTLTYTEEHGDYIRHEHLSYPGGGMVKLEAALKGSLETFLKEIKSGQVKRDGLATPKKD